MKRIPLTLSLASLLALAGCQASGETPSGGPIPTDHASTVGLATSSRGTASGATTGQETEPAKKAAQKKTAAKKPKPPTLKELQAQLTKAEEGRREAQRKQRYADAELEIAALEAAGAELGVVESLRAARASVEEARSAMERFDGIERPIEEQEAALEVGQAEERLQVAETDLLGILEIYAEETEARAKDEIIRRHRMKAEVAKERVTIAKQKRDALVKHALPARMREKSEAVWKADAALAKAEASASEKRRRSELSVEKAKDLADDAKRGAKKAGRQVDAARKRVNDRRESQTPKAKDAPKKETSRADGPQKDSGDGE